LDIVEYREGNYLISTDTTKLDLAAIHDYLSRSYWAKDIPLALVRKAIEHSLCFGLYDEQSGAQIGFARVISDYATYSYLADVFILEAYRGRGLSKWLMRCILDHPELQLPRTFFLATRDAHGLYSQFGFAHVDAPKRFMSRRNHDVFRDGKYVVMTTIEDDE
jgi:N-acetylglutamate synthase-like GNAT family acetyltransferase